MQDPMVEDNQCHPGGGGESGAHLAVTVMFVKNMFNWLSYLYLFIIIYYCNSM